MSAHREPADPNASDQGERTGQYAPRAPLPGRPALRLFIGIPLAAATTNDLSAAVHQLRSHNKPSPENLRWSEPESWHITLQFLGSTTPQQYECITAHLRELDYRPIPIQLGRIGTFPRAGILFADVRVTPELAALQQAVTAASAPCGFVPEDRPYHPHITLARRKGKSGDREFRNLQLQINPPPHFSSFTAESFVLYESTPTPDGSRYEIRERFPLDARIGE
ncbi:MAG TPA: RNA 2',3'-cyclic phosphodiesterase [Acidobacteriaceae bacterium]|jgi:2'-5' RNA ligase